MAFRSRTGIAWLYRSTISQRAQPPRRFSCRRSAPGWRMKFVAQVCRRTCALNVGTPARARIRWKTFSQPSVLNVRPSSVGKKTFLEVVGLPDGIAGLDAAGVDASVTSSSA